MKLSPVTLNTCIQLRMTKHPSRKFMNFRHLLICDTIEAHVLGKKANPLALEMQRMIQQTMFVWICELQTPKSEHACRIKTDCFLTSKLILMDKVTIIVEFYKSYLLQ